MLGFLLGSRGSNQREQLDGTDRLEESVQGGSDLLRASTVPHSGEECPRLNSNQPTDRREPGSSFEKNESYSVLESLLDFEKAAVNPDLGYVPFKKNVMVLWRSTIKRPHVHHEEDYDEEKEDQESGSQSDGSFAK